MKRCLRCNEIKLLSDFNKNKNLKDGLNYYCRCCSKKVSKKFLLENKEKVKDDQKKYYKKNSEIIIKKVKEYRLNNLDKIKKKKKEYSKRNREHISMKGKIRRQKNKENPNPLQKIKYQNWQKNKLKSDPLFKLSRNLRRGVWGAFKYKKWRKDGKTEKLLGASYEIVKKHIEKQFRKGMKWGNQGEWHIDHKIPLASAKTVEDLKLLCHYTNLQPLWGIDNVIKNAKILPTQMTMTI